MNSSVKFLSPIVIGGLPLPGPDAAAADDELGAADELEADDDELELPQAASTATVATVPAVPNARLSTDCITSLSPLRSGVLLDVRLAPAPAADGEPTAAPAPPLEQRGLDEAVGATQMLRFCHQPSERSIGDAPLLPINPALIIDALGSA